MISYSDGNWLGFHLHNLTAEKNADSKYNTYMMTQQLRKMLLHMTTAVRSAFCKYTYITQQPEEGLQ